MVSSLSRPLNEETLGLLHVKRLVEVVLQAHLSLEETLGLLHMIRLVEVVLLAHLSLEETLGLLPMLMMSKPPLPRMMMSKSPSGYFQGDKFLMVLGHQGEGSPRSSGGGPLT